jgi:hypothetical protein
MSGLSSQFFRNAAANQTLRLNLVGETRAEKILLSDAGNARFRENRREGRPQGNRTGRIRAALSDPAQVTI